MRINNDRSTILDISSDITVLGMILAVIQLLVYDTICPEHLTVLMIFLGTAALWKLISPFSETKTSWSRYIQAILLVLIVVFLSVASTIFH
jgi:hypothetical protein